MSKRQPIEVCIDCTTPFLDLYAIQSGERGRRPKRCPSCKDGVRLTKAGADTARWREQNRDRKADYDREYRKTPQARTAHRERVALRRAKLRGVNGERISRTYIYDRDRGICHLCGKRASADAWDMDHIVPLSLGGEHTTMNVAVSHPECNRAKGSRAMNEQLRMIG